MGKGKENLDNSVEKKGRGREGEGKEEERGVGRWCGGEEEEGEKEEVVTRGEEGGTIDNRAGNEGQGEKGVINYMNVIMFTIT